MAHNAIGAFVLVFILYVYTIQVHKIDAKKIFIDDLINNGNIRTGDMILFKATNAYHALYFGNYFTHVGIVYLDEKTGIPYIFEANGAEGLPIKNHHNRKGIFFSPLQARVEKYSGYAWWKPLRYELSADVKLGFKQFISYCLKNMEYDMKIFRSSVMKWLGLERCNLATNCGELTFLTLIKLGLLDVDEYYRPPTLHYLRWVTNITKLKNNTYLKLVELIHHPFHS